jgi:hypothetical protein
MNGGKGRKKMPPLDELISRPPAELVDDIALLIPLFIIDQDDGSNDGEEDEGKQLSPSSEKAPSDPALMLRLSHSPSPFLSLLSDPELISTSLRTTVQRRISLYLDQYRQALESILVASLYLLCHASLLTRTQLPYSFSYLIISN